MRKAVFTTARMLFAAGATGMLGIAVLTAPTSAWASSGGCSNTTICSLAFTPGGQPAGTTVNTTITSSFDSPGAGPVQVAVVDQFGNIVTNAKASIAINITSTANPGSGALGSFRTPVKGQRAVSDGRVSHAPTLAVRARPKSKRDQLTARHRAPRRAARPP